MAAGLSAWGIVQLLPLSLTLKGLVSFAVYVLVFSVTMIIFRDSLYREMLEFFKEIYRKVFPVKLRIQIRKLIYVIRAGCFKTQEVLFTEL